MDVDKLILSTVLKRVQKRVDSLEPLSRFAGRGLGIEGWFKVETIAALEHIANIKVNNKGPDLTIVIGGEIKEVELKAHNLRFSWVKEGIKQHEKAGRHVDSCLFLIPKGKNLARDKEKLRREGFQVSTRNVGSKWIVGTLKRKQMHTKEDSSNVFV